MHPHDGILSQKLYRRAVLKLRNSAYTELHHGADLSVTFPVTGEVPLLGVYSCKGNPGSRSGTDRAGWPSGGSHEHQPGASDR